MTRAYSLAEIAMGMAYYGSQGGDALTITLSVDSNCEAVCALYTVGANGAKTEVPADSTAKGQATFKPPQTRGKSSYLATIVPECAAGGACNVLLKLTQGPTLLTAAPSNDTPGNPAAFPNIASGGTCQPAFDVILRPAR